MALQVVLASCAGRTPPVNQTEQRALFPSGALADPSAGDDGAFARRWYAEVLRVAGEPALYDSEQTAVRLIWLRSFDTDVIVRAVRRGDEVEIVTREVVEQHRVVDRRMTGSWWAFSRWLDTGGLRSADAVVPSCGPPDETGIRPCSTQLDGSVFVIELIEGGEYTIIERRSSDLDDPTLRSAAFYLLYAGAASQSR